MTIVYLLLILLLPGGVVLGLTVATVVASRRQDRQAKKELEQTQRRLHAALRLLTPEQYRDYAKQVFSDRSQRR